MSIEDTATANGAGWQGLPQDKSITGDQHDWLGELEAHKTNSSRLNRFVAVERNRCHGLGCECVEVNVCAML